MSFMDAFMDAFARTVNSVVNSIDRFIKFLVPEEKSNSFATGEEETSRASLNERIKKIDAAKENLNDAVAAIDELRAQADINKRDLDDALVRIKNAEQQKTELSKQLDLLKQVADADTTAFRKIVGLPSKSDLWRERLLGFVSGIIASIIASMIFLIALKLFKVSS